MIALLPNVAKPAFLGQAFVVYDFKMFDIPGALLLPSLCNRRKGASTLNAKVTACVKNKKSATIYVTEM